MCQDEKNGGAHGHPRLVTFTQKLGEYPIQVKLYLTFPTGILLGFFSIVYIYLYIYIYICVCVTQSNFAVDNFQAQR